MVRMFLIAASVMSCSAMTAGGHAGPRRLQTPHQAGRDHLCPTTGARQLSVTSSVTAGLVAARAAGGPTPTARRPIRWRSHLDRPARSRQAHRSSRLPLEATAAPASGASCTDADRVVDGAADSPPRGCRSVTVASVRATTDPAIAVTPVSPGCAASRRTAPQTILSRTLPSPANRHGRTATTQKGTSH